MHTSTFIEILASISLAEQLPDRKTLMRFFGDEIPTIVPTKSDSHVIFCLQLLSI